MNKGKEAYEDIINLSRPVSKHPPMSALNRAAQFAPFAALTGYEDAVKETARLTEQKKELEENKKELLDKKLQMLSQRLHEKPQIEILYFVPDVKKDGGSYQKITGIVRKIDFYQRVLILTDQKVIRIDRIIDLNGSFFIKEFD